jgi:hypothetical protein
MTNPSPAATRNRPVALVIAVQMRVAQQRRPPAPVIGAHRVAHAIAKARQSSPAMRRNPAAVQALAAHLRPLAGGNPGQRPLGSAIRGMGALGAARAITADARKAFRRGEAEIRTDASHTLSPGASRHADAAARGLRRGGLGLLSAAYHGVAAARDLRKTTREARKAMSKGDARPGVQSSHALSDSGSRHAEAAAAGLQRGGLGLLSAAYHGFQALRDVRRGAHGGPSVGSDAQGSHQPQESHAIEPMRSAPMSSSDAISGSLPWQAIGRGLQALHALATAQQGQGESHGSALSPFGGAHAPLSVMLIARGRQGGAHSGARSGTHGLAAIPEHDA